MAVRLKTWASIKCSYYHVMASNQNYLAMSGEALQSSYILERPQTPNIRQAFTITTELDEVGENTKKWNTNEQGTFFNRTTMHERRINKP